MAEHKHILKSIFWFENEMIKVMPRRVEEYKYCIACNRIVKIIGEAV